MSVSKSTPTSGGRILAPMNPPVASPFDLLARLLTVLIALFGASARCVRRVAGMRGRMRAAFGRLAANWVRRGHALAYAGEDDATVDRRLARMQWMAADPRKALRHLSRRADGLLRARLGGCAAPLSFAPPALACAALGDAPLAAVADDTS